MQVFLSMLVKVTSMDLPLWHQILVLEILRVTSTIWCCNIFFYVLLSFSIYEYGGIIVLFKTLNNEKLCNLVGILCRGADIANSFPKL